MFHKILIYIVYAKNRLFNSLEAAYAFLNNNYNIFVYARHPSLLLLHHRRRRSFIEGNLNAKFVAATLPAKRIIMCWIIFSTSCKVLSLYSFMMQVLSQMWCEWYMWNIFEKPFSRNIKNMKNIIKIFEKVLACVSVKRNSLKFIL